MFNVKQITAIGRQNIDTTVERYKYLHPSTGNSIDFGLKIDNDRNVVIVYAIKTSFNNSMEFPMYVEIPSCGNLCNADLKLLWAYIKEASDQFAKEGKRDSIPLELLRQFIDKADPEFNGDRDEQGKRIIKALDPFTIAATEIDLKDMDHLVIPGAYIIEVSKDFSGIVPKHWHLSDLEEEDKMFLVMDDFEIPDFNSEVIKKFMEEPELIRWTLLITNFIDNALFESVNSLILEYMNKYGEPEVRNIIEEETGRELDFDMDAVPLRDKPDTGIGSSDGRLKESKVIKFPSAKTEEE